MTTILLAEDDTSLREYLARALDRSGYAVTAVGSGVEALHCLCERSFDLLLTDIVMPEMDGIELSHRAAALYPALRMMFITGFAAITLAQGGLPADAKILSKPFHLRDLVAEVDRLFSLDDVVDG